MGLRGPKRQSLKEHDSKGSWRANKYRKEAAQKREKKPVPAIRVPDPAKLDELIKTVPGFDPFIDAGDCQFIETKAREAIDFFHKRLVLVEGRDSGKPFILQPHQQARIANLYGWRRPDGTRRFREAYISEARKNGKTVALAGMVAMELAEPVEEGSQIYSAASERNQARLIFRQVSQMVQRSEDLKGILRVWKHSVVNLADELTSYQALSAEATSAHGLNPQLVAFDELHLQKNRDLYDAFKTGMGARDQPLLASITTAGHDRNSICYEVYAHAKAIMDYSKGEDRLRDPEFFPAIHEVGEEEDWTDESVWAKANPNLGVTVKPEFLRSEFRRAQANPAAQNAFRQLFLNQWTQQSVRWIDLREWDLCKCSDPPPVGAKCFGGLDLGISRDLTAFVVVFKVGKRYIVRPHFWMPEDNLDERMRRDHVPYRRWADSGLITLTAGRTTDYGVVRAGVNEIANRYGLSQIGYDPYNADQLAKQLGEADGFEMVIIRQGFLSMSEPSKLLDKLILDTNIYHDGNPVLRSHAENAAIRRDPSGNIKPDKDSATGRIDGIVATVMALRLASLSLDDDTYDDDGPMVISW